LRSPLFLLLAVFLHGQALALEKCVGPDGKISYSDRPCAAGAKGRKVEGGASLEGAQIEYYDVGSPGGHMGRADWHVSYQFTTRPAPGGCAVASVTTKLALKVRLPRWTPAQDASADLQARWARYMAALEVHEAGHLQNGRDFEGNFKRVASGMSGMDCGALDAAVRAQFDSMSKQAAARDRDYDTQTQHGATQGAFFR
jgi:predicted secreted Zn-dependent protease